MSTTPTTASLATEAKSAMQKVNETVRSIGLEVDRLSTQRAALVDRIAYIKRMPLPLDDVKALIRRDIDEQADVFARSPVFKAAIASYFKPNATRPPVEGPTDRPASAHRGLVNLQDLGRFGTVRSLVGGLDIFGDLGTSAELEWPRACFFFGDAIFDKAAKYAAVHTPEEYKRWRPAEGDPATLEERRAAIEKLAGELDAIDAQVAELTAQLAELQSLGVNTKCSPTCGAT